MDVGGATGWSMDQVVSQREILEHGGAALRPGRAAAAKRSGRRPSGSRCRTGRTFGVIASTTAPFCRTCDRGRITADGTFLLCLYGENGLDLRELLRGGATDGEIADAYRRRVAGAGRSRSGGARRAGRAGRAPPDREPPRRSAARDAHARRLMALQVALIQPQIPPNTGNIARLCAATDVALHLIEPLGFSLDDADLRRAGLDYWDDVDLWRHPDWFAFRDAMDREPLPVLLGQGGAQLLGRAVPAEQLPRVRQRDRGHADADPGEASRALLHAFRCRDRCAASTSRPRSASCSTKRCARPLRETLPAAM